jgi:RHS repeat-associated protein
MFIHGNIKTMQRNDKRGTGWMDNMTYNYGIGTTQSNKLLKVEDMGDDFAGFIDGNPGTTEDYTYDANGNLTRDLNKGIGTSLTDLTNIIAYNYLNLAETVTKGGNTIRYIYDATGRKLSQVVTTGTAQKQTDYVGEFTYENDALQYISHEEGRIMMSSTKLMYTNSFDVLPTDITSIGATVAAYAVNGQKYVSVKSNSATGINGILPIGSTFNVVAGERFRIRAKAYRTTNIVYLQVKAGATVLGNATLPNNATNEGWIEQIVTIPTGATTLQAGLVWGTTVALNEMFYLNEFEITKLETTTPEYQYNLKDHLGNVRLTFTTKQETDAATATLEAANTAAEKSKFLRYDNARRVSYYLFDRTNGSAPSTTPGTAQRLRGKAEVSNVGDNEKYGLARSLSVMPGDVINMEVYGKYIDSNTANLTTALNTFISQIAAGTAPVGTVINEASYGISTSSFPSFAIGQNGTSSSTGTGPKAYLNWLVFDRNYVVIAGKSGYQRLTTVCKETGQDVAHEKLSGTITIAEPGYVYVYLSNEEGASAYEVYFDDFKVDQVKSPVIQTDDYYPFGSRFNSYSRENSVPNKYLYNKGSELQDDLGLDVYQTHFRMLDTWIGRWWQVDPKPSYDMSVYNSMNNNPILNNDPLGDIVEIKYGGFLGIGRKTVTYGDDGKLTRNGQAFTGKVRGYLGKAVGALNNIRSNGGQSGISQLVNSKNTFTVRSASSNGDKNEFKESSRGRAALTKNTGMPSTGSGGTIFWNPANTTGGKDQSGGTSRPSYVGLAHEAGHAMAADVGMSDFSHPSTTDPNFANSSNDEFNAAHFENTVRAQAGLPLRENYGVDSSGTPVMQFLNPGTNVNSQTGNTYQMVVPNIPGPLRQPIFIP